MGGALVYPRQEDVDSLRETVAEVRISRQGLIVLPDDDLMKYLKGDHSVLERYTFPEENLGRISDIQLISRLFDCMQINENKAGGWVCPTSTRIFFEFLPSAAKLEVATPSIIRWEARWLGDAELCSSSSLAKWLAEQGIPELLEDLEREGL